MKKKNKKILKRFSEYCERVFDLASRGGFSPKEVTEVMYCWDDLNRKK